MTLQYDIYPIFGGLFHTAVQVLPYIFCIVLTAHQHSPLSCPLYPTFRSSLRPNHSFCPFYRHRAICFHLHELTLNMLFPFIYQLHRLLISCDDSAFLPLTALQFQSVPSNQAASAFLLPVFSIAAPALSPMDQ